MTGFMFIAALGTASAGSSDGADHEASIGFGLVTTPDENWQAFSSTGALTSFGARGGVALNGPWTLLADAQVSLHGGNVDIETDDDGSGEYRYISEAFGLDLGTLQLGVGPKYDLTILHWLRPYATVQALGMLGRMRMDEDPFDDDNARSRFWSVAPGGAAALGLDVVPGATKNRLFPAMHLEMGYAILAPLQFSDDDAANAAAQIGELQFRGFYLRWGVGAHF